MDEFWQQVVTGLATGSIYGLLALAIVLIYRSTTVINFAQGELAMFTTFVAWSLLQWGDYWVVFPLILLMAAGLGAFIERVVIRPVEGAPTLNIIIVTLGLFAILNNVATIIWGGTPKGFRYYPITDDTVSIGSVVVSMHDLAIMMFAALIMIGLYLFFQYTPLGLAMRATAQNPVASRLMGIRVGRMLTLGWALSATVGAVAGMFIAPLLLLQPPMMLGVLLYAFAAAVLGGLDSPFGAVVGGLIIGVTENLVGTYSPESWLGPDMSLTVTVVIIIFILLVRPTGIFGKRALRRV
ncbi:MAG: branched-chain amino acid ABC transporter permease [Dehalococcoidia bacterium]